MESGGLMQRIKALVRVLIPLFVSSFRARVRPSRWPWNAAATTAGRAARRMKVLHLTRLDAGAALAGIAALVVVILCNVFFPPRVF